MRSEEPEHLETDKTLDEYLYERYRFSAEGITYLYQFLEPYVANTTHRSRALTVPQTMLRYFATGTYMYSVMLLCYPYSLGCLS